MRCGPDRLSPLGGRAAAIRSTHRTGGPIPQVDRPKQQRKAGGPSLHVGRDRHPWLLLGKAAIVADMVWRLRLTHCGRQPSPL
jgi:hypothetical protein